MLKSRALTKIQSIIVTAIIVVAALGGAAYFLWDGPSQSSDTIKIGVLADIDAKLGKNTLQGVILAADQINSEGGVLGKQIEVVSEDNDVETGQDILEVTSALTRLLTYHKVDFIIGQVDSEAAFASQDLIYEHKKVMFAVIGSADALTQRVIDNYEKYKYYFKVGAFNATSIFQGITDGLLILRENTGFNKIGYIAEDLLWNKGIREGFDNLLSQTYGFELVYKGTFPSGTVDFSSYLAGAESAGVEILVPLILVNNGIPFIKEWYDRQSPTFIYGGILFGGNVPEAYEWTDGKCEYMAPAAFPVYTGYPLTSHTLATRDAYLERWGESPLIVGGAAYDTIRFILPDAIKRAGTIETEAVIEALEETSIETSMANNFVFTPSHDIMMGENPNDPEKDYMLPFLFQWQNGEMVPVYPEKIRLEAGATFMFPPWPGPWD